MVSLNNVCNRDSLLSNMFGIYKRLLIMETAVMSRRDLLQPNCVWIHVKLIKLLHIGAIRVLPRIPTQTKL